MVDAPTPAGWYPQPGNTMRYWDGAAWTDRVHSQGSAPSMIYEGIRWLGVRWGRSGKPLFPRIAAVVFTLITGMQVLVAFQTPGEVWPKVMVGLFAFVAFTYWADAHFCARVAREQQPQPRKAQNRKSRASKQQN